ncbi:hypothetical protein, partial [Xenorhabdus beddingii]|uniref:hypothetical protein n=1 Tax=Xenorhabdus beddingii TaxID=40578 RepID=UPI00111BD102
MTNSNECREAFEKFLLTEFGYPAGALSKYGDGKYFNIPAQNYWEAFQAGWKRIRRTEMSNDV